MIAPVVHDGIARVRSDQRIPVARAPVALEELLRASDGVGKRRRRRSPAQLVETRACLVGAIGVEPLDALQEAVAAEEAELDECPFEGTASAAFPAEVRRRTSGVGFESEDVVAARLDRRRARSRRVL
jgi:hypothetical protein